MADLIVDSHLIATFRNRVNSVDAISELIDNSLTANATNFEFQFGKDEIVVADNGDGLENLNLLARLGASQASQNAINIYGIGSKDAVLHFGSFVTVESVCDGKYRRYEIDWDKVERLGTPKPHNQHHILPISTAPASIKKGGTKITISRLSHGRSRIYPDAICKRLSHRYRPALRQGKKIDLTFSNGKTNALSADAGQIGLWNNEREITGFANERPFFIRYGDLREYDRNLTGIHIGYGNRFIEHLTMLNGKTLPPLFYAEVMLASRWRDCLSPNKTAVVRFRDELEAAIYDLMKGWISELEAFADEARVEKLNVLLQKHTADIFVFKPSGEGYSQGRDVTVTGKGRGKKPVVPKPHEETNEAVEKSDGDGSREKRKRRPSGLRFKRKDTLGNVPFEIETDLNTQQITVNLNGSIPAIDTAYRVPYKIPALWPLISAGFAGWIRENLKSIDEFLPGFFEMLRKAGYDVDHEYPLDTELYVFCWMMRQHPPSVKELEADEAA